MANPFEVVPKTAVVDDNPFAVDGVEDRRPGMGMLPAPQDPMGPHASEAHQSMSDEQIQMAGQHMRQEAGPDFVGDTIRTGISAIPVAGPAFIQGPDIVAGALNNALGNPREAEINLEDARIKQAAFDAGGPGMAEIGNRYTGTVETPLGEVGGGDVARVATNVAGALAPIPGTRLASGVRAGRTWAQAAGFGALGSGLLAGGDTLLRSHDLSEAGSSAIIGAIMAAPIAARGQQSLNRAIAGKIQVPNAPATSPEQLKQQAATLYDDPALRTATVNNPTLQNLATRMRATADDFVALPEDPQSTGSFINRFHEAIQTDPNMRLERLAKWRSRFLQIARQKRGDEDGAFATRIAGEIGDLIDNLGPHHLQNGNAAGARTALQTANQTWRTAKGLEVITDAIDYGDLVGTTNYAGGNWQNEVRKKLRNLIKPGSRTAKDLTPIQRRAIREFAEGGAAQNFLRSVGMWSPHGGQRGQRLWGSVLAGMAGGQAMGGTLAMLGNPIAIAALAGGYIGTTAAKLGSDALTARNADKLVRVFSQPTIRTYQSAWQRAIERAGRSPHAHRAIATAQARLAQGISEKTDIPRNIVSQGLEAVRSQLDAHGYGKDQPR